MKRSLLINSEDKVAIIAAAKAGSEEGLEKSISLLKTALNGMSIQYLQLGELYVELLDSIPNFRSRFMEEVPCSSGFLAKLERIGRHQLVPELATSDNVQFRRLSYMPYEDQQKYMTERFEVLTGDGKDKLRISLADLQPSQIDQVFAADHVRTIPEQRAYLEERKTRDVLSTRQEERIDTAYEIKHKKLVVYKPITFSASDIMKILPRLA